jgi:hypothetical protein
MHALHRPHLPRAVVITMIAAALAIVVTLIFASAVSDLPGASSGSPAASSVRAVHHRTAANAWSRNPFTPVLTVPVVAPWTNHTPFWAGHER